MPPLRITVHLALAEPTALALALPEGYLSRTVLRGVIAPVLKKKRGGSPELVGAAAEDFELVLRGSAVCPSTLVGDVAWGDKAVAVLRVKRRASLGESRASARAAAAGAEDGGPAAGAEATSGAPTRASGEGRDKCKSDPEARG